MERYPADPSDHRRLKTYSRQVTRHCVAVKARCPRSDFAYASPVPKLWSQTIDAHRRAVRDAILETTTRLVGEHGLRSVTMSQIAEEACIGRATLYKYFPDVESILLAWNHAQITGHLERLATLRDQAGAADERLQAVLETYAMILRDSRGHHDAALAAFLHQDEQVANAQRHLTRLIEDLLSEAAGAGDVRRDVSPGELATYCFHALTAASTLPSRAAIRRLVAVTMAGLQS